jgi:hypothetical protein
MQWDLVQHMLLGAARHVSSPLFSLRLCVSVLCSGLENLRENQQGEKALCTHPCQLATVVHLSLCLSAVYSIMHPRMPPSSTCLSICLSAVYSIVHPRMPTCHRRPPVSLSVCLLCTALCTHACHRRPPVSLSVCLLCTALCTHACQLATVVHLSLCLSAVHCVATGGLALLCTSTAT